MENITKVDLSNVSFRFMVEDKFTIRGRGVVVAGKITVGKISNDNDVIITNKTGEIKRKAKVIISFFCSSKMKDKNTAYELMNIVIFLKDTMIDEVEINDYIVML